jgi:hypothetical protein
MKNEKAVTKLYIALIILGFCTIIYGIGYIKYEIWRAEHPKAETWTFFIPNR